MKKIQYAFTLATTSLLFCCMPQKDLQLGEPFGKVDGIKGAWKLEKVIQVDEDAKEKNKTYQTLDLTPRFQGFTNILISFTTDEANNPVAFQLTNPDSAPIFGFSGTHWTFDNIKFPSLVLFTNEGGVIQDSLRLLAPIRIFDQDLKVKFSRYCNKKAFVTYEYTFKRQ